MGLSAFCWGFEAVSPESRVMRLRLGAAGFQAKAGGLRLNPNPRRMWRPHVRTEPFTNVDLQRAILASDGSLEPSGVGRWL